MKKKKQEQQINYLDLIPHEKKLPKALSLENPSALRVEITFYVMEVHAVKTAVNPRSQ